MSLDAKTQQAKSKTLTNSEGRWSIDHGKGLEDLYANAAGSVFTNFGGGNLPAGAKSPGLNDQIGKGSVNRSEGGQSFFGFGRGNTRGSATNLGSENIAGGGRKAQPPKQKGSVEIKGFTTFRVPMTDHDYGTNKDEVKNLAMASWFTQGLKDPAKYGATMKGLGGRSTNSRSGGKQTRDNASTDGGGGGYQ